MGEPDLASLLGPQTLTTSRLRSWSPHPQQGALGTEGVHEATTLSGPECLSPEAVGLFHISVRATGTPGIPEASTGDKTGDSSLTRPQAVFSRPCAGDR